MSAERDAGSAGSASGAGNAESASAGRSAQNGAGAEGAPAGRGGRDALGAPSAVPSAAGVSSGGSAQSGAGAQGTQAGRSAQAVQSERDAPGARDGDADPGVRVEGDDLTVRDPVSAPDAEGRPRRVTRRFPLFTKDTARPEGGGRAASGDAFAPARQWPVLAVLGLVGLGLLVTAFGQFRLGTLLIGIALLGGGAMRWLLPDVGMLAVRSRFTDIVTYGVMGLAIVLLAMMAQPDPWLQIPFLKDTLHFTVTSE
ncbi:integral membrane protein [Streptomyces azureus]|uniref:Integral membrane protein n=1 Tax=Streptomyces azureus TaxID=146537 RepID=A0A0K8PWM0_STRAJ|nr:integral membrane protein [Streptomyces azureus]